MVEILFFFQHDLPLIPAISGFISVLKLFDALKIISLLTFFLNFSQDFTLCHEFKCLTITKNSQYLFLQVCVCVMFSLRV